VDVVERPGSPRIGTAVFWSAAAALVAIRLVLAARFKVLLEIEHIWRPIAHEQAAGGLLWDNTDYHFFPIWGWILMAFERAERAGASFAAIQRGFLSLVDVGIAALVYRLAGRVPGAVSPRAAALAFLANPVAIFVSAVQGQFDGLALFFLLAALLHTVRRPEPKGVSWAGVLLGLSVAAKQVTMFHPLLWLRRRRGILDVAAAYGLPLLTLLPYARSWRVVGKSLLVYYSVPRSYGLSELVLWDSRFGPFVQALGLAAALAAIVWLRTRELVRSCLFLFLVLLFFASGMGSQYLLWPLPFGALFGGRACLAFTGASTLWIVGTYYAVPGSGQFMGQLVWITVGIWMFFESRALGSARAEEAPA
jgi:hypothetical protein